MTDLPFIDEHVDEIDAAPGKVYEALERVVAKTFEQSRNERLARLLGCRPASVSGPRPLAQGSTVPGFEVSQATPGERLVLDGSHRFSSYRFAFVIDEAGPSRSRVRATTWAEFPGLKGKVYRAFVIGSGGHRVVVRRIQDAVRRRALRV